VLDHLALSGETPVKALSEVYGLSSGGVSFMEKKGWISLCLRDEIRSPFTVPAVKGKDEPLSPEQAEAFRALRDQYDRGEATASLLYGVTGSGKTRVMLALCDHVLKQGRRVVYLVPEIALTGQSAALLIGKYGDRVAVIHSALSDGERHDAFVSIRRGEKDVILGTRSAVFAPVEDLGLIVIDEEQDGSYKSDTLLKYHARDVARFRCARNGAMLLLASATPDVESYYKAKSGAYSLIHLTKRFGGATLPEVKIADLRGDLRREPGILLGRMLRREITENLDRNEQTILLMNRRGYRQFLSCLKCGEVVRCPNCSVSLTVHSGVRKRLSCHYCGYTVPFPAACPACGDERLITHGAGIQQLEEELGKAFPAARVLRMDSDTLTGKGSHEAILSQFRERKADILIGTQMVAKGHNFPQVTLVGVVMADTALYLSDYRAAEHTFSLLTQVIGRAGRAEKPGRAVVQTLNPYHNVFSLAASQDYEAFYENEIAIRRTFLFPPFCRIAALTLSDEDEGRLLIRCRDVADRLQDGLSGDFSDVKLVIYGPFEAPVYKMKNVFRKRFIFKYKNDKRTRAFFDRLLTGTAEPTDGRGRVSLDTNPSLI
ncbi:MAG: primosomal protein N', partial [Clostridia bacterium]|nr:primosomal protein N' [Clostridia bacterium]